jgi:hypothetical protein
VSCSRASPASEVKAAFQVSSGPGDATSFSHAYQCAASCRSRCAAKNTTRASRPGSPWM